MTRNLDHHLQQHGRGFRVRLEIPGPLRPQFQGKRFLLHSLGPVTLSHARILRGPVLTGFELLLAQARNPDDPLLHRARSLRREWEIADTDQEVMEAADAVMQLADDVEAVQGKDAGTNIFNIATGTATPLKDYLEEWLADQAFIGKTALQHRKSFTVLADWCTAERKPATLQAITRKVAWEYIEKHLKLRGLAPKTINRYLSAYRTHWRWLMRRQRIEANPWIDTHISERPNVIDVKVEDHKTAFTDAQVTVLLSGEAPDVLPDLMPIAALTGARIDAICDLRVRDCAGGAFKFKRAKKEPRGRTIPIHSRLEGIVARRSAGKAPEEFLFHELPAATKTRPRSAAASQAFTRYRRRVGVGAGKGERSRYDFHSFRRWFTTKAEQAGQPPHIIDFVTGHKRPGETLGRYSEGPSMGQMRECVEAIRLPRPNLPLATGLALTRSKRHSE